MLFLRRFYHCDVFSSNKLSDIIIKSAVQGIKIGMSRVKCNVISYELKYEVVAFAADYLFKPGKYQRMMAYYKICFFLKCKLHYISRELQSHKYLLYFCITVSNQKSHVVPGFCNVCSELSVKYFRYLSKFHKKPPVSRVFSVPHPMILFF